MLEYAKRLVPTERRHARFSIADFEGYASVAEVFLTLWQDTDTLNQIGASLEECQAAAQRACKSMQGYARIYAIAQPRAHFLQGWLSVLEDNRQDAIQLWNKGLSLPQTSDMPYEEARLRERLSKYLPSDDPAAQLHRERARQLFEMLNARLDLVGRNEECK